MGSWFPLKRGLDHGPPDRGRERAAGRRKAIGPIFHQHRDSNFGSLCGGKRDIPRVRWGMTGIGAVLCGTRLGCDLHAGDGPFLLCDLLGADHQLC